MENKQQTPQLENGFIRIATGKEENDILMALIKANLNSTEYQIVLLIIRKTWGYGKKEDWISITQFMKYTGKGRTTIIEALNKLVRKSVLVRKSGRGVRSLYRLNKDFNTWNKLVRKTGLVRKTDKSSTENRTPLVRKSVLRTTKDNITKETITKDNIVSNDTIDKKSKSFGNEKVNLILDTYKRYFGFSPTDRKPRFVAQSMVKNIEAFIKEAKPYKQYTFEEIVEKAFDWYSKREIKGETLDVVRRKVKKLFELTFNKLKGGEKK
jgi:phage replication O-like protein O